MKNEKILNALGKISDELIEDAAIPSRSSKRSFYWKALIASAACFCLLLTAVFSMLHFSQNSPAGTLPVVTDPTATTSQGNNEDYIPFLSAYDVAGVLTPITDRNETNAYTVMAYPKDYLAKMLSLPTGSSVNVYNYLTAGAESDQTSIRSLSEKVFVTLEKSLGINIPKASFVQYDNYDGSLSYIYVARTENYTVMAEQDSQTESITVMCGEERIDSPLVFQKTAIKIDPLMNEDAIREQFAPTAQIINAGFGTSFNDMAIVRSYDEYSPNGISGLYIVLYNEEDEPGDRLRESPVSDYILISFYDVQESGVGDEVGAVLVSYVHHRIPVEERLIQICEEPILTLEQAEEMLEKGYVFGGHSCSLCMQAQEKVDFSEYDHVGFEYVMGEADSEGIRLCVPFYAFYKRLEPAPNGNEIYAKTYVCAVPMTDIDAYFEMQTENHS